MITLAIKLEKRKLFFKPKKGYPVKLRVTNKRNAKFFSISDLLTDSSRFYLFPDELSKIQSSKRLSKEDRILKNDFDNILKVSQSILDDLGISFSFDVFKKQLKMRMGSIDDEIIKNTGIKKYIKEAKIRLNNPATEDNYDCVLGILQRYFKEDDPSILKISASEMKKFQQWFIHDEQLSPAYLKSTVSRIARCLNIAADLGEYDKRNYPFGRDKYQVPTVGKTKPFWYPEEIQRIEAVELDSFSQKRARALFMTSYHLQGMNITDIMALKKSQVNEKTLTFIRSKTMHKRLVETTVYIHEDGRYWLDKLIELCGAEESSPYLLNLNKGISVNQKVEFKLIRKQLAHSCYKALQRIKKIAELDPEKKLNIYAARHAFAVHQALIGTPIIFISRALAHASTAHTENYLAEFPIDVFIKTMQDGKRKSEILQNVKALRVA